MKRDLNLVREILLWAENQDESGFVDNPCIPGYTREQISYHVFIMSQAGLVVAYENHVIHSANPEGTLASLTWDGHEFLSAVRNEALWKKATKVVLKEGQSFTFEFLKAWLKSNFEIP